MPFFSEAVTTVPYTCRTVVGFALQEGYSNIIPRTLLDAGLQRLRPRAEVTPEATNYLCVIIMRIPIQSLFTLLTHSCHPIS